MTIDITAMRASLSAFTGYGAVEVESYRQDVGALLDALEAANAEAGLLQRETHIHRVIGDKLVAEIEELRATVAALRASVPPTHPSDYGHEAWSAALEAARAEVDTERAAVVAWLRENEGCVRRVAWEILSAAADHIERGEHRREETK
jgi:hypothetical protein